MRKRIAVLVAQIDETTQNRFLTEFIKEAYTHDYDVCIFSMYQKFQETPLRDIGDSNIFTLVNYDLFSAIVLLVDTILTPGLAIPLQERVKENFKGPVLVIDQESPYFESVMIDHYTPVKKIIDHLIEVHGYTKIAFIGGKEGHPHSVQRLNGFLDSMAEHGLTVRDDWIYHGNYWYDSAEEFVDILLENRDDLPQALACANDCMAIGAASRLIKNGICVPDDMAVTGYDSLEDGRSAPDPLTSAMIPADECGKFCLLYIDSILNKKEKPVFEPEAPLFIGGSCGCQYTDVMVPLSLRSEWKTEQAARGLFSDFNHILEDLLSQSNLKGFMETILLYSHQIEPFHSFSICMNDFFLKPEYCIGEKALRRGYTDNVCRVLYCGEDTPGEISFENMFSVKKLIPELKEERDYPTTYIFNPLYFDDRCFGYTVLNYGNEVCIYDKRFRIWMKDIMQGMESFYRQQFLQTLVEQIKASQVRDSLTGLYNYEGFIKNAAEMLGSKNMENNRVNIVSIDIKGIKMINEIYGRDSGDKVIEAVARFVQNAIGVDEICCRMCNDEFLVAFFSGEGTKRTKQIIKHIKNQIKLFYPRGSVNYEVDIQFAELAGNPMDAGALEALINHTVNVKDHKKASLTQNSSSQSVDYMDEIKRNRLVAEILDKNLMTYYYQPIVKTEDGSIFAYEALMRYEKGTVSPFHIIQAAIYLKRLPDVERATLLNVTADVEHRLNLFGDARVFVNSLPGVHIPDADNEIFTKCLEKNKGRFVIEFTEESEIDDGELEMLKNKYNSLGSGIAIDDYGAGYSNVNNLLRYMPDYVKIDRQLVTRIETNPQKQHFVSSIIEFAHDNNILALAEGVETKEELQVCIKLGIDLIQGFYTGKPSREPIGEISEDIREEVKEFYRQSRDWKSMYTIS